MPLTKKGKTIYNALRRRHDEKTAKRILYAGENAGTFTGIHAKKQKRPRRKPS